MPQPKEPAAVGADVDSDAGDFVGRFLKLVTEDEIVVK